ncbi:hypothetical protein AU490_06210 [Lonsdalea populi]|uniref:General stress protein n=1 Tax=Lonsdalea populi TaxID=1172565 RepID=A0A3N0UJC4_9GAMM|nr:MULTISPECIES: NAD(P)H-dependent oxidoreductase [Lonsdalea]RAT18005.1 hypothetical protein AU486_02510 [Lonsdalea quercina]RAT29548.1 hypothetical protein AU490_06210 [Lonsdalea populi]RAT39493.1 hypothetical protein AU491_01500 [Lonsdalea populi]RAT48275.1 hypothetical protein AU496_05100 [Lonsdalea populi]RAT54552.1 hypothetical protein AU498_04640 [Lonsdalea populi]
MSNPLVIVAHPTLSTSRVNIAWIAALRQAPSNAMHDLCDHYPDETINVQVEQHRQSSHERTVLPFPFHGDNCPPLLKHSPNVVLEHGRAFSHSADALKGKQPGIAVSTRSTPEGYRKNGRNGRTMEELPRPFEDPALRVNMRYLPGCFLYSASDIDDPPLAGNAPAYCAPVQQGERASQ